jgi:hypothetical protein
LQWGANFLQYQILRFRRAMTRPNSKEQTTQHSPPTTTSYFACQSDYLKVLRWAVSISAITYIRDKQIVIISKKINVYELKLYIYNIMFSSFNNLNYVHATQNSWKKYKISCTLKLPNRPKPAQNFIFYFCPPQDFLRKTLGPALCSLWQSESHLIGAK